MLSYWPLGGGRPARAHRDTRVSLMGIVHFVRWWHLQRKDENEEELQQQCQVDAYHIQLV